MGFEVRLGFGGFGVSEVGGLWVSGSPPPPSPCGFRVVHGGFRVYGLQGLRVKIFTLGDGQGVD